MATARAAHTLTPLPDGSVLVLGGFSTEENALAGAERFDPRRGAFAPLDLPLAKRQSHTATVLADGRVLLVGGLDAEGRPLSSAEIYDPRRARVTPAGSLVVARAGHTATLLSDGRVLVTGGVGEGWSFLSSAEIYDPRRGAAGEFRLAGAMSQPRESHTATRLADGRVLVAGGHAGRGRAIRLFDSAELFEPASGKFSPAGRMLVRRHKHDAVLLPDGRVLVTGGADERDDRGVYREAEFYDAKGGQFVSAGALVSGRYKHAGTSVVLPDGSVLLAGGAVTPERFEPRSSRFVAVPLARGAPPLFGQFSAVALLPGGRALIAGGYGSGRGPQALSWIYTP